jgi:hypothetical protein
MRARPKSFIIKLNMPPRPPSVSQSAQSSSNPTISANSLRPRAKKEADSSSSGYSFGASDDDSGRRRRSSRPKRLRTNRERPSTRRSGRNLDRTDDFHDNYVAAYPTYQVRTSRRHVPQAAIPDFVEEEDQPQAYVKSSDRRRTSESNVEKARGSRRAQEEPLQVERSPRRRETTSLMERVRDSRSATQNAHETRTERRRGSIGAEPSRSLRSRPHPPPPVDGRAVRAAARGLFDVDLGLIENNTKRKKDPIIDDTHEDTTNLKIDSKVSRSTAQRDKSEVRSINGTEQQFRKRHRASDSSEEFESEGVESKALIEVSNVYENDVSRPRLRHKRVAIKKSDEEFGTAGSRRNRSTSRRNSGRVVKSFKSSDDDFGTNKSKSKTSRKTSTASRRRSTEMSDESSGDAMIGIHLSDNDSSLTELSDEFAGSD